jgi:hypothetical protein
MKNEKSTMLIEQCSLSNWHWLLLLLIGFGGSLTRPATAQTAAVVGPGTSTPYSSRLYPDSITNGIMAHWRLEETGVSGRTDATGQGRSLTASTSIPNAAGKLNNAVDLNGIGGVYLNATSDQFMFGDTSFTVAGWVWFDALTASAPVFWHGGVGHFSYFMDHNGTVLKFSVSLNGSSVAASATSTVTLATSTWYFFRCWHDAATDQIGIQINTETEVVTAHSGGTFTTVASHGFYLGERIDTGDDLDGRIDSVSIWRRHLPGNYHTALYNSGLGLDYPF